MRYFGVSYDPSQVGRLVKKVGWSRQKPQTKARQQNMETITQWQQERSGCPNLKKAQAEGRVVLYVDKAACYLLPLLAPTWAPCGQTPVIVEQAGRAHLTGPPVRSDRSHCSQRPVVFGGLGPPFQQ